MGYYVNLECQIEITDPTKALEAVKQEAAAGTMPYLAHVDTIEQLWAELNDFGELPLEWERRIFTQDTQILQSWSVEDTGYGKDREYRNLLDALAPAVTDGSWYDFDGEEHTDRGCAYFKGGEVRTCLLYTSPSPRDS